MILKGKVKSGMGDLTQRMEQLESYYTQKTGLKLFPGSLNIELDEDFVVDINSKNVIRLEGEEYGGTVSVSILPCKIFNRKAFIIRTDKNNEGMGHHSRKIIEVATDIKLRDEYNLFDDDIVEVEISNDL
jgi:riboflavin kinase